MRNIAKQLPKSIVNDWELWKLVAYDGADPLNPWAKDVLRDENWGGQSSPNVCSGALVSRSCPAAMGTLSPVTETAIHLTRGQRQQWPNNRRVASANFQY
mgnify:CR=1 FL=1